MDILLTFAGNRDPFNPEVVMGLVTDGPVLTLLAERSFAAVHIFTTPNTLPNAQQLQREIAARTGDCRTRIHNIDIPDPTDYEALFLRMSGLCREILEEYRDQKPVCSIATASGTPQMQTVWFLLAQSGLVPATLLKITPPRFLRPGQKAVSEIRLSLKSFPRITLPSPETLEIAATYLRKEKLEAEREELVREFSGLQMIGRSTALTRVMETVRAAARYDSAVLIQGETGTGKELVARAIHFNSARKTEPMITVNCAAIPETLVESELFGHEKGAFTGADRQKKGKFELANRGTIFLDEIGDMPLPAQAKILRVLQDKAITRVGGEKTISADVRVIAATNRNLTERIADGKFREDLYYRLRVIDIPVPALRERREDIPLLVEYFLDRHNRRYRQKKQFTREAMRRILEYSWPGNVRELENAIERAFVLSGGNVIEETDLPPEIITPPSPLSVANGGPLRSEQTFSPGASGGRVPSAQTSATDAGVIPIPPEGMNLDARLLDLERATFEEAIRSKDGNREAAARLLGVKPHTFRKRAKEKFGL
ncbi:MAG: sigma 54-interacting transcriptional regulator [Proteobacteria bacterium]|nr:sigma 54-interacting transcriptional regulator [Pseudomonadota bacterium]